MTRRVSVVTEPDDHGYDAYCPELRGCQTQGQTPDLRTWGLSSMIRFRLTAHRNIVRFA